MQEDSDHLSDLLVHGGWPLSALFSVSANRGGSLEQEKARRLSQQAKPDRRSYGGIGFAADRVRS
jgi:hypothetical protein